MNRLISIISVTLSLVALTSGCASRRVSDRDSARPPGSAPSINLPDAGQPSGSEGAYDPVPSAATPESSNYGPEPVQVRPIVLVLGEGWARAFAAVGVIRALDEGKVPIGALVTAEMGSLIGAIRATSANLNQFEWALMRFKDDWFAPKQGLLANVKNIFQKPGESAKLDAQLSKTFAEKDVEDAKIPLRIAVASAAQPSPVLVDRGSLAGAVRASIAVPEFLAPVEWQGGKAQAPKDAQAALVEEARALHMGPIVVLDASGRTQSDDADVFFIRPALDGIDRLDFKRRTDIAFRGKAATLQRLDDIKRAAGLLPPLLPVPAGGTQQ